MKQEATAYFPFSNRNIQLPIFRLLAPAHALFFAYTQQLVCICLPVRWYQVVGAALLSLFILD